MRVLQKMLNLSTAQIDRSLSIVRLTKQQNKLVRHYSLGMKQRLGIAMALARDPALLILDEPTNGLDPAGIEEIRNLLVRLTGEGITIMVSSHLLDEIDKMANILGILSKGKMIFQGTRDELFQQSLPDLLIKTPDPQAVLREIPDGTLDTHGIRLSGINKEAAARIIHRLSMSDIPLYEVRRDRQSLEAVFMDLTQRGELS